MLGGFAMSQSNRHLEVGTEEWLNQTAGRLTIRQAISISAQGSAQVFSGRLSRSRIEPLEANNQASRVTIARDALASVLESHRERVLERQGEALLNHACRTYLLGAALISDELFQSVNHTAAVVAALAHDDGLANPARSGNCFTVDSAKEVDNMMHQLSATNSSADAARAAVISHFQPKLPMNAGADAKLVAAGASADVMGFGLKRISTSLLTELWQEWPDLEFISDVRFLLKGERTRAPRTRPGVLALTGMPYLTRSGR
jgi:hypothetical protein